MAQVYAMPATVPERSHGPGCDRLRPEVPVVVLDEAMLASGFLVLRSAVVALLRSGASTLVVDVSALDRLSSSTVSALLWAQRRCRTGGGAILLRGVSRPTARTLRRTGLGHVLAVESGSPTPKEVP